MKNYFTSMLLVLFSLGANAATVDTVDYTDNGSGYYFVPPATSPTASPYYRNYNGDWGWQHNAISETITTATLSVSAWDVDEAPCGYSGGCEVDTIEAYDASAGSWISLGSLAGDDNSWSYTTFDLTSYTELYDDISTGLMIQMNIDSTHTSSTWLVSLAKSVLNINEGVLPPPNPNVVPVPAAVFMFAPALLGLLGLRRKSKLAAA